MDLPTLQMDRTEARKAFLEYRRAVRARHDEEDAAIMRGYRALANGHQVVRLSEALAAGGLNDQQLPALAVARADRRWCYLQASPGWTPATPGATRRGGSITMGHRADPAPTATQAAGTWRWPLDLWAGYADADPTSLSPWQAWRAMVPVVPPALRPAHALSGYVVLWEVDRWERTPAPPGDPALLKRIGGDLYAVVAVWDLTELERAVLAGRRD